jgi:pilus assembly protein CpaE
VLSEFRDTDTTAGVAQEESRETVSAPIRVIVLNTDEEAAPELRAHLLSIDGVKIVAEVEEPAFLGQVLDQFPAEVLLIHLDPNPQGMMDIIAPALAERQFPAAVAMTEDRDAELVMKAMRVGMKEFLWKPFPPEQLNEILQRMGRESTTVSRRAGKLIPIVATCGGCGATTLATNLAVELAQCAGWGGGKHPGKPRVAVVDLDFRFGQVALFLDAQPTYTIAELCESPEHIDQQMIERAMVQHSSGAHVLAHPQDLAQAERISAGQVAGALSALQEHYDFIVLDGPVRFDPTARVVFDMADAYLMVIQLLVPAVRNTDRMLQSMASNGYSLDRLRLVVNRQGREAGYLESNDVEATLGRKIDWFIPDDWKTSSGSVNMGMCLLDHAPKSRLRLAYRDMAHALAGVAAGESGEGDETTRSRGLFGMFAGQKG